jgi:hypothetical protein
MAVMSCFSMMCEYQVKGERREVKRIVERIRDIGVLCGEACL